MLYHKKNVDSSPNLRGMLHNASHAPNNIILLPRVENTTSDEEPSGIDLPSGRVPGSASDWADQGKVEKYGAV